MKNDRYVVFDVETPNGANDRMSAIGITIVKHGEIAGSVGTLVNPETYFAGFNVRLTGITPAMAAGAPTFPQVWRELEPIFGDSVLAAHNAPFDMGVLSRCLSAYGIAWRPRAYYICTCTMGRACCPGLPSYRLDALTEHFGIELDHHKAESDSRAAAELLVRYMEGGADPSRFMRPFDFGGGARRR